MYFYICSSIFRSIITLKLDFPLLANYNIHFKGSHKF